MIGTQVTIRVHAHYVQTCVRLYGETALSYTEYALFGASIPRMLIDAPTRHALRSLVERTQDEEYDVRAPYFPEFDGWLELRYTLPDPETYEFFMEDARYVEPKRGGRNITGGFRNAKFKRAILVNVANAIKDKDANRLNEILKALDIVGG